MEKQIYRALVVDDDQAVREATARAMSAESFWCDTAGDGQEALKKYRESRHDLVVTDLRMPRMHGYALTVELLKDAQRPRIVVLTGLAEPGLVKDLITRGVDDVVSKPVDVRVFAIKMASIFERDNWRESYQAVQERCAGPPTGHSLVAHIEHALERSATRVSPRIEELFAAVDELACEPPQAMISYLERMFMGTAGDGDRRKQPRASLLATLTVVPLGPNFEPSGEPFKAAARDASEGGLSMLHTRAVRAEHLALRWESLASVGRRITLVLRVDRCQPLGPFYEVAGEFIAPS
jgi:CheY-like chemotaxis protein